VDVCFLMDCTGSMGNWIQMCKDQLRNIVDLLSKHYPNLKINISFVGYHDHNDSPKFDVLPFTSNVQQVRDYIAEKVHASGGNDIPEDVCGGLRMALDLVWSSNNKLIILIADAPCHGTVYHHAADDYPHGDPDGLHPEVLLSEGIAKGIEFFFAKINDSTDTMLSILQDHLKTTSSHSIKIFKIAQDVDFLANISDAIASVQKGASI